MYHRVLLCYDGSRAGRAALREGADLARACGAEVHLLAVLRQGAETAIAEAMCPGELYSEEARVVREILDEGVAQLGAGGQQVQGHLAAGEPVDRIVDTARAVNADLIVLGHRNRSRFARWWQGSVNASLLEAASCSILVVLDEENRPLPEDQ
ncbi:MAG: universal stress protein [Gammaproteobacteria bacterium]